MPIWWWVLAVLYVFVLFPLMMAVLKAEPVVADCNHKDAHPVELRNGELVAWWCEECQTTLYADEWSPPVVDIRQVKWGDSPAVEQAQEAVDAMLAARRAKGETWQRRLLSALADSTPAFSTNTKGVVVDWHSKKVAKANAKKQLAARRKRPVPYCPRNRDHGRWMGQCPTCRRLDEERT